MLTIGCHLSTSKGYTAMGKDAIAIGANTFQFFTRNPRGSKAKEIKQADIDGLLEIMAEHQFPVILAHAPYTLNPCSDKPETREFAAMVMSDDLQRMEYLPHNLYNFHPGSHVGQGVEKAIPQIASLLNDILTPTQTTTVLLETMAGKGSEVGAIFPELASILEKITLQEKMGICLDTCHIYDGGYDIVKDLDGVLEQFDRIIGIQRLKAIHVNDSLNPLSSHKDRHAKIGEGHIGINAFEQLINHPALRDLPFFLETPNELDGYQKEIQLLRSLYREKE